MRFVRNSGGDLRIIDTTPWVSVERGEIDPEKAKHLDGIRSKRERFDYEAYFASKPFQPIRVEVR